MMIIIPKGKKKKGRKGTISINQMSISRENDISQMENRVNRVKNEVYKKKSICMHTYLDFYNSHAWKRAAN